MNKLKNWFNFLILIGLVLGCIAFVLQFISVNRNIDRFVYKNNLQIEPIKNQTDNKKKFLVFTSAGDNTNFYNYWVDNDRLYDIWIVYYGENNDNYNKYKKIVDFIIKGKGSKFQNFYRLWKLYKKYLIQYERVWLVDDDIEINTKEINELFKLAETYDFWVCQPAFTKDSQISHDITVKVENSFFRYVNFIECGVPLLSRKSLIKFMEYYDPKLIGWGIDYFMIWILGQNEKDKYAIIDSISCKNPFAQEKKNNQQREHTKIKNSEKEQLYWNIIMYKYNIRPNNFETYKMYN